MYKASCGRKDGYLVCPSWLRFHSSAKGAQGPNCEKCGTYFHLLGIATAK